MRRSYRGPTAPYTDESLGSELDDAAHDPRALVPRLDAELRAGRRLDDPLELHAVGGRLVVSPPERAPLLDTAGQLARLRPLLAAHEPPALGERQRHLQRPHRLPV